MTPEVECGASSPIRGFTRLLIWPATTLNCPVFAVAVSSYDNEYDDLNAAVLSILRAIFGANVVAIHEINKQCP
jgi:hypothetical protein